MSLEIDDLKFSLDTMESPEKELVEELKEKIALANTDLITKRDLKEGTLN